MIDDAKIRSELLKRFPQIDPGRFEMEEYEYGDRLGVTYLDQGFRRRLDTPSKGKTEAELADELAEQMAGWFAPSIVAQMDTAISAIREVSGVSLDMLDPPKRRPGRPRKVA